MISFEFLALTKRGLVVADCLAKQSLNHDYEIMEYENPLGHASSAYIEDLDGVSTQRTSAGLCSSTQKKQKTKQRGILLSLLHYLFALSSCPYILVSSAPEY